jgi:hypothetical protein
MGLKENVLFEKITIWRTACEMRSVIYVTAYSIQQRSGTEVPATENTRLECKLQHVYAVTK